GSRSRGCAFNGGAFWQVEARSRLRQKAGSASRKQSTGEGGFGGTRGVECQRREGGVRLSSRATGPHECGHYEPTGVGLRLPNARELCDNSQQGIPRAGTAQESREKHANVVNYTSGARGDAGDRPVRRAVRVAT